MEKNNDVKLPDQFFKEYSNIPELPTGLYKTVARKIDNRIWLTRTILACAASLVIAVSLFQLYHAPSKSVASFTPEVAEALSDVSNYFNDDVYEKNENSYAYYQDVSFQQ